MQYTKAQREQAKREILFRRLFPTYPEGIIAMIKDDDYIMLPALVKAIAVLHIDHFNYGSPPDDLQAGTDSQTQEAAWTTNYFGITECKEDKGFYDYFQQLVSTNDIESHVKAGNWAAKDVVIALSFICKHYNFLGLSNTTFPFRPDMLIPETTALLNALVTACYLKRIGDDVQWTARIAPYMLMWNWYEDDKYRDDDPIGELQWKPSSK